MSFPIMGFFHVAAFFHLLSGPHKTVFFYTILSMVKNDLYHACARGWCDGHLPARYEKTEFVCGNGMKG